MNKHESTFKKGLRIFWTSECKPILHDIWLFIKFVIVMPIWVLFTGLWLIAPKSGNPWWINCLGGIGVVVPVVLATVLFIRHVIHLANQEEDRAA